MENFTIVGTGLGIKEYILPQGISAIEDADILIAGERNLEPWLYLQKESYIIKSNLSEIVSIIKNNYKVKKVVILVSGDPGFYSLLNYISKFFNRKEIKIIPGISSMQMAFAKAGLSWHDAVLLNLHGRKLEIINDFLGENKIGMLTDPVNNPLKVCQHIVSMTSRNFTVLICINLGYNNEDILEFKINEYEKIVINEQLPAVMILIDEEKL
ncbi:MAG: precorrin-6y C5,15-methyltransferase (decarboxylating) subunit CbiE [Clostridia bacterium]|nr:precorrin-6y C5,15-methyltransferase (decarboxylating) subunit CbiE [Clostridia bacterium]